MMPLPPPLLLVPMVVAVLWLCFPLYGNMSVGSSLSGLFFACWLRSCSFFMTRAGTDSGASLERVKGRVKKKKKNKKKQKKVDLMD